MTNEHVGGLEERWAFFMKGLNIHCGKQRWKAICAPPMRNLTMQGLREKEVSLPTRLLTRMGLSLKTVKLLWHWSCKGGQKKATHFEHPPKLRSPMPGAYKVLCSRGSVLVSITCFVLLPLCLAEDFSHLGARGAVVSCYCRETGAFYAVPPL